MKFALRVALILFLGLSSNAWAQCHIQALQKDVVITQRQLRPTQGLFLYRMWCEQPTRGTLSIGSSQNGIVQLHGRGGAIPASIYINNKLANRPMELELSETPQVVEVLIDVETRQRLLPVDDYGLDFEVSFKPE